MANSFQDLSQVLVPLKDTFPPQVFSASGNGNAIDVSKVGTNRINARLHVGDAVALTSLDMKMQASPDGTTGWVDIEGATFDQVTTDGGATGLTPQTIPFQLPEALDGAEPYSYVRGVGTLVGTSVAICVSLEANAKYDGGANYVGAPGNGGNNIIN